MASTPYQDSKTVTLGVTQDGTIRSCPSNVNPNCVSTASINELYSPAWRTDTRDPKVAAEALERTVLALFADSELARSESYDFGEYRAFLVPSLFGRDIMEFLVKGEFADRGWDGDVPAAFVTYRSLAGSVKYVWPIQQPISDFGVQKQRIVQVREQLGWKLVGCELLECYAE